MLLLKAVRPQEKRRPSWLLLLILHSSMEASSMRQVFRRLSLEGKVAPIHTSEVRFILYLFILFIFVCYVLRYYNFIAADDFQD